MTEPTIAEIRASNPEWANPAKPTDAQITFIVNSVRPLYAAATTAPDYYQLFLLHAAHGLYLFLKGLDSGGAAGDITGASAGEVSASFGGVNAVDKQSLLRSPYGELLYPLRKANGPFSGAGKGVPFKFRGQ